MGSRVTFVPKSAWAGRISLLIAAVFALSLAATAGAASAKTLHVSPSGKDTNACTKAKPCKTISHAVARAHAGDTVSVAHGTYAGEVVITKDIKVIGVGRPIVNALGMGNGFVIFGRKSSGATLEGFVVQHATFEGILAGNTSRVKVEGNLVRHNDLGETSAHAPDAFHPVDLCNGMGQIPGDCGEGLHLVSVTRSRVSNNTVTDNAGGIYLTDELGPNDFNVVSHNRAVHNTLDCGITLAGHNNMAVSPTGATQPKLGGVYRNTIVGNVANDNGIKTTGGGILLGAGAPGSGVYGNLVKDNTANGNGHSGVTLHSHAPGQDLNGNKIIGNKLSHDDLLGDEDFGDPKTTGILVASAVTSLKGIVIAGNHISNVHYGIWTKNVAKTIKAKSNKFKKVAVRVTQT